MPPLKILHVIPSLSTRRGGPTEVVLALVRYLREEQVQTEIVTTNDDGPDLLPVPTKREIEHQGVPVRFLPRFSPPWPRVREFAYAPHFFRWLRENGPDYDLLHVHALYSYLPSQAMAWARRNRRPYLVTTHGLLGTWPRQQSRLWKKAYAYFRETRNLQGASVLHFTSRVEAEEAAVLGLRPLTRVIPPGLELPRLLRHPAEELRARYGLRPDENVVLFLSRFHAKKGLDLLLPALAEMPSVRLILAGGGETVYEQWLRTELARTGLTERTIWAGFVSGAEKQLLLQGADVLVLPSRHENFGLVVLEALAGGTPVVISDQVALAREVQAHRLGAVCTLDVAALRTALRKVLAEPKPAEQLREYVRHHYAWPVLAGQMHALYREILARQEPGAAI